jgi:hypothetical protein
MITIDLNQTAVWWTNQVHTGAGGRTFDTGVEIAVRWEDKTVLFIDANGQERQSEAVVYTGVDVVLGDCLYLGTLADLDSDEGDDPLLVTNAREVRRFDKTPDLEGTSFVRKVFL